MSEKIKWESICPACKSSRTGTCESGAEPHRYCCGREVKTKVVGRTGVTPRVVKT